jgi:hypothetical protein
VSAARDLGRDVLPLAQQVRRSGGVGDAPAAQLEEENRRLKAIVADQALDLRALKDVLAKNGYGPR